MSEIYGFDRSALDRARISRDARFDGKFFIGVTSTGIYCRPICPSPTSKSCNVRYYATAAAAAEAGFRPCLRCRPEAAPGTPAWHGTSAVVRRALRLIQNGALDELSVDEFASRLGITARHLRRLFLEHVGASPIVVAQTRRLQFAKRLLDETHLPITEIALAAGFGSVRRFNDTFRKTYRRAPGDVRSHRRKDAAGACDEVALKLSFRPPYDWHHVLSFLAEHSIPGVECVDASGYTRTLATDGGHATVSVRPAVEPNALELRVRGASPAALLHISTIARRMFDLAADPSLIALSLQTDALLGPLVRTRPGLRIPGAWDPLECTVLAVLSQQESASTARMRVARLIEHTGQPINSDVSGLTHLFPSAATLAAADLESVGIPGARAEAVRELALATVSGRIDFTAAPEEIGAALAGIRGIDERTVQYVALRALGEPDAFPATDLAVRRIAATGDAPLTPRSFEARAEPWRPWRGYAAIHLWRQVSESRQSTAG